MIKILIVADKSDYNKLKLLALRDNLEAEFRKQTQSFIIRRILRASGLVIEFAIAEVEDGYLFSCTAPMTADAFIEKFKGTLARNDIHYKELRVM